MRSFINQRLFAVLLCVLALCTALAACAPAGGDTDDTGMLSSAQGAPNGSTAQAPRTTVTRAQAFVSPEESGFVGSWSAAENANGILSMTFSKDGSATLVTQRGQLGGSFTVTGENTVLLIYGGTTLEATFAKSENTMTLSGGNIDLVLTKSE